MGGIHCFNSPMQWRIAEICSVTIVPALFGSVTGRKDGYDAEKTKSAAAVAAEETSAGVAAEPGKHDVCENEGGLRE